MTTRRPLRFAALLATAVITVTIAGCVPAQPPPAPVATAVPGAPVRALHDRLAEPLTESTRHLATMTLRERVASLLMLHYPGTDAARLARFADQYEPAGLILMGDNVPASSADLSRMLETVNGERSVPLLTAVDQEGGIVRRLPWETAPGADVLKSRPAGETLTAFAQRGKALADAGIDINFGVVADQTDDASSFIYDRVLGTSAEAASERVAAAVEGERDVASTLKHFPGHGASTDDSHTTIPTSDMSLEQWTATQAPPFAAGIAAGAEMVMFGHLRYTTVDAAPASLSGAWHDILRDDLGFEGVIVSDDMLMLQRSDDPTYANPSANAIAALVAGTTLLLYVLPADPSTVGVDIDRVIDDIVLAVGDGRIPRQTIDEAALLLLEVRLDQRDR